MKRGIILFLFGFFFSTLSHASIFKITVNAPIHPITSEYIRNTIEKAEKEKASLIIMTSKARKGETIEFGDIFLGFENFGNIFVAGLIFSLGVGFGFSLCIIPGVLVGGILLYFLPDLALKRSSIGNALDLSKDEAMKNLVNHSLFFLVISLVAAAGMIACFIGLFFTLPVSIAAMTIAYEDRIQSET